MHYLPGFLPLTEIRLSPVYSETLQKLHYSRLWLAPTDKGFQEASNGTSLFFGRIATGVCARSSEQEPGSAEMLEKLDSKSYFAAQSCGNYEFETGDSVEKAPDPDIAMFVGWWNDHYEAIAHYSQEYERLNQIMKWGLIVSWLNSTSSYKPLSFLHSVPVARGNWFSDWVKQHAGGSDFEGQWDALGFHEQGYLGTKTGTLHMLFSEFYDRLGQPIGLQGGVILASMAIFRGRAVLPRGFSKLSSRSHLDYKAIPASSKSLRTFEGTRYEFKSSTSRRAVVGATAGKNTTLRTPLSELADNTTFEQTIARTSNGHTVEVRAGDARVGSLHIEPTENGFRNLWNVRELDAAQSLAIQISKSPRSDQIRLLTDNPRVESFLELPDDAGYLVKLDGAERWLKVAQAPPVEPAFARVAAAEPGATSWYLAWVDSELPISDALSSTGYLTLGAVNGRAGILLKNAPVRGPPEGAKLIELQSGQLTIKARLDPQTGELYFLKSDLPENFTGDPSQLQKLMRPANIQELQMRAASATGPIHYTLPEQQLPTDAVLLRRLRNQEYTEVADQLALTPKETLRQLQLDLSNQVALADDYLRAGDDAAALRQLNSLIYIHGPQPELTARRALVHIRQHNVAEAAQTLNDTIPGPVKGEGAWWNEVNIGLKAWFSSCLSKLDSLNGSSANIRRETAAQAIQTVQFV